MYVDPSGYAWETVFDLFSLGISVVEVIVNPASPGSWIGLTGDILDLIPFVTGLGEAIRGVKIFDKATDLADSTYDTIKIVRAADYVEDFADDGYDIAKALKKQMININLLYPIMLMELIFILNS